MPRSSLASERYQSRLKALRVARGLSQAELAESVGLTRQAIYRIEANRYLPNATTALRLAKALQCKVEDVFLLDEEFQNVEAELLGESAEAASAGRMKVWKVSERSWALPLSAMGEPSRGLLSADALALPGMKKNAKRKVVLQALGDPAALGRQIAVAGCDPALFVIADRMLRGPDPLPVVVWPMGSTDALVELGRRTVHLAGVHLRDASGEFNLPFLRKHLGRRRTTVVTLAFWQMGLVVSPGNPKSIRSVEDLARRDVNVVNREKGSGARQLLDRRLAEAGIPSRTIAGYGSTPRSRAAFSKGRRTRRSHRSPLHASSGSSSTRSRPSATTSSCRRSSSTSIRTSSGSSTPCRAARFGASSTPSAATTRHTRARSSRPRAPFARGNEREPVGRRFLALRSLVITASSTPPRHRRTNALSFRDWELFLRRRV